MLVRLHTFIRSILRKNRSAFVPPALITEAINQASYDLWRELIQNYKTSGRQSDLLSSFKKSTATLTPSSGVFSISAQSSSVVTGISIIAGTDEYPTRMLPSDSEWSMRKELPVEINNEKLSKSFTLTGTDSSRELPSDFLFHKNIIYTDATFTSSGKIVSPEEFLARKEIVAQNEVNLKDISEDLVKISDITISAGPPSTGDLPNDYLSNTGVFFTADNREGVIVTPDKFNNKNFRKAEIKAREEDFLVRATIDSSSGAVTLPLDFLYHKNVFYSSTDIEGVILTANEFLERKNSNILTPTETNPIATIYGDQIEILPAATGYKLPYISYYSIKNPIATIHDNKMEVLPSGSFTYRLPYISKYSVKNPIATVYDNKISVLPSVANYVVPYIAHATERLGYSRFYVSGAHMNFQIDPIPANAKAYYITTPNTTTGTYVFGSGIVTVTTGVELNWDEAAFSQIANRSLVYLGVSIGDTAAIQIESVANQNENYSSNNDKINFRQGRNSQQQQQG